MNSCILILFTVLTILLIACSSENCQQKQLEEPSSSKKFKNDKTPAGNNVISDNNEKKEYIAVIGGGINAALFTHYLHELLKVEVHIYNHKVIEKIENSSFIVHEKQKYMMEIISKFKLNTKDLHSIDRAVVMYNGQNNQVLSFEQNDFIKPLMESYIKPMILRFKKIYDDQQKEHRSFVSPQRLLLSQSEAFPRLLNISTREHLREKCFRNLSNVKEIIHSLLLINYGQNLESNAFAGLISLIFSQFTGKLKRITTPIDEVVKKLLGNSDRFLNLNVLKVTNEERARNRFRPRVSWIGEDGKEYSRIYDYVVLATPEIDDIDFSEFKKPIVVCKNRKMVFTTIMATFKDVNFENSNRVTAIANVKDSSLIRLANKISNSEWKILADDDDSVLTEISTIFNITGSSVNVEKIALWPDYSDKECISEATFVLDTRIFYLNAIEWASSLLEMKAIGAKNVALRIKKFKEQLKYL